MHRSSTLLGVMGTLSKIHIFGASGSGVTTLGSALALELGTTHLDTDDYYWTLTDPPFVMKNDPADRINAIRADIANSNRWILSGSICSWGDPFLKEFTLGVFVELESTLRMQRLRDREAHRYGDRINPNGDMYEHYVEFMRWAESYDYAKAPVRSRDLHISWMTKLSCPILKLNSVQPIDELVTEIFGVAA